MKPYYIYKHWNGKDGGIMPLSVEWVEEYKKYYIRFVWVNLVSQKMYNLSSVIQDTFSEDYIKQWECLGSAEDLYKDGVNKNGEFSND